MENTIHDFFDSPRVLSEEEKHSILEARNKIMEVNGGHTSNDAYKNVTGEDVFNFEENKKELIDNLNTLLSESDDNFVKEFTFRKKYEELQSLNDYIKGDYSRSVKPRIWEPTNINDENLTIKEINNLRPTVIVVKDENERLWTTLRYFCHSAEYNQAPGRFIKFLMIDENTDKIIGITSIASDVISISDRDKYIGWTRENKLQDKMLKHSAIGTTIVATQPFGINFLGGKLIAALLTTEVVRNEWENQSSGKSSRGNKLVGMTTTSLYGKPSMYNSMKWWTDVGYSKGKIPIQPKDEFYEKWHQWLKQNRKDEYDIAMTQKKGIAGPVTGAKMRVLSMMFNACGIKQSDYCHGFKRGVYYSCFYENTREFLCKKITDDELIMKPLFIGGIDEILKWWKPKAISRYLKLKSENRLNPNKLYYNNMIGMSYEEAKLKYFNDVGR